MAILIPSKNIYEKQNQKIKDNFIDNISVEQTVIAPNNEFGVAVENFKKNSTFHGYTNSETDIQQVQRNTNNIGTNYYWWDRAISYIWVQVRRVTAYIYVPKVKNNKRITEIEEKLNVQISTTKSVGTASAYATYDFLQDENGTGANIYSDIAKEYSSSENATIEKIEPKLYYTYTSYNGLEVTSTVDAQSWNYHYIKVEDLGDNWRIYYEINTDYEEITMGGDDYGYSIVPPSSGNLKISGNCVKYEANKFEITLNGNTIGISLTDGSVTYGEGNKPHSLNGNELVQDSATTNGTLTTQYLADNILTQYKNGKETAQLLCDISDYYFFDSSKINNKGDKVIAIDGSTGKMCFRMHDIVIPMVLGVDGIDKPMSLNKDGSPKQFMIFGTNIQYSGVVLQKIFLQET